MQSKHNMVGHGFSPKNPKQVSNISKKEDYNSFPFSLFFPTLGHARRHQNQEMFFLVNDLRSLKQLRGYPTARKFIYNGVQFIITQGRLQVSRQGSTPITNLLPPSQFK